jgi:hypothetical protein
MLLFPARTSCITPIIFGEISAVLGPVRILPKGETRRGPIDAFLECVVNNHSWAVFRVEFLLMNTVRDLYGRTPNVFEILTNCDQDYMSIAYSRQRTHTNLRLVASKWLDVPVKPTDGWWERTPGN